MAQELAAQLLTLSQHAHEATLRLQAHRAMGQTLYWRGEFSQAHAHFDQGIALYDPRQHHSNAFVYGQDPASGYAIFLPSYCGITAIRIRRPDAFKNPSRWPKSWITPSVRRSLYRLRRGSSTTARDASATQTPKQRPP